MIRRTGTRDVQGAAEFAVPVPRYVAGDWPSPLRFEALRPVVAGVAHLRPDQEGVHGVGGEPPQQRR